ncbi:hypothetical protein ACHQM5_009721 [Ranunculus cassubicifolius]
MATEILISTDKISSIVEQTIQQLKSDDPYLKISAAKEIRRLTKTSLKYRRQFSSTIEYLVSMLKSDVPEFNEFGLLALLNLAVKDEKNKVTIIQSGALDPLISFLLSCNSNLREYATAAFLTLSASAFNKPTISASGAIPLLVDILRDGSPQAKVDSLMTLYNLSTLEENLTRILSFNVISPIVTLLRTCKKSSKTAEKCTALLESLMVFEEGRVGLTSEEGGVLAVVEILENGSLQSRDHAVGALLTMCESDRAKYREPILKEGVIPGLLELTVQGMPKSQVKARTLLHLLRNSPYPRSEIQPDTLENIVTNIVSQFDGEEQGGKAKKMLADMVQVSMEQSLKHLQQRAFPIANKVSSK